MYAVVSVVSCLRFKVLRSWQGHPKLSFIFILYVVIVLVVQLMPLPSQTPSSLALFKSRLVLPFWYKLLVMDMRTTSFHVFFGLPLGLGPSTSCSIHFLKLRVWSMLATISHNTVASHWKSCTFSNYTSKLLHCWL